MSKWFFQCKQRERSEITCRHLTNPHTITSVFSSTLLSDPPPGHGQYSGTQPKIQFSVSKRGGQLLWLDGLKYFRNNENRTNFFWRCHWYYRHVRCPVLICMNKYDSSDFRQIHEHCHVKPDRKERQGEGGSRAAAAAAASKRRSSVPNALDMFSI